MNNLNANQTKFLRAGMSVAQHLEVVGVPSPTHAHLQLSIYLSQAQYLTRGLSPAEVSREANTIARVLDVLAMQIPESPAPQTERTLTMTSKVSHG